MSENVVLSIIEIFIGLVVEGVILSMVFNYISNKSSEKQNQHLKSEMSNIETQNKFTYEQIIKSIENAKTEIISEIKEVAYTKGENK